MSKTDTFENNLLAHIFQNAAITLVGDATGLPAAATVGSLFLSLHTADPGEASDQTTNEISYTGYARVAVARTSGGFTIAANAVSLAANADFPERTDAASATATHFGIGCSSTGTGKLLYKGALTPSIVVSQNTIPRIKAGQIVTED